MPFIDKNAMPSGEPLPGWRGFYCQSSEMSFVQYDVADGASIHEHHHQNEEVWIVVEGNLEVTLDHETRIVGPGDVVVIASETPHSLRALSNARAIVADHPARTEFLRYFSR